MRRNSHIISSLLVVIYAFCIFNHGLKYQGVNAVRIKSKSPQKNETTSHKEIDPENVQQNEDTIEEQKVDHLSQLDPDIQSKIADILLKIDDESVLHLRETSKYWRNHLHDNGFSKYSVIGKHYYEDADILCDQLEKNPNENYYNHVRFLAITKRLWDKCDFFNNKELTNIDGLLISVFSPLENSPDQVEEPMDNDDSGERMLDIWSEIYNKREQFPKLQFFDVKNKYNEGILHVLLLSNKFANQNRLGKVEEILKTKLVLANYSSSEGLTPLHYCFIPELYKLDKNKYFDTIDCVKLLIRYGADPNVLNPLHFSPTHFASALFNKEPLEFLLANGGDMNLHKARPGHASHLSSESPISVALKSLMIIERPHIRNWDDLLLGMTQSFRFRLLLSQTAFNDWVGQVANIDLRQNHPFYYLLKKGADLSVRCGIIGSVLGEAIAKGNQDLAIAIIENENFTPDLANIPDFLGRTPAMMSLLHYTEIFDRLVEKGANLSQVNEKGENILHFMFHVMSRVNVELVKKILDHGVDVNSVDNFQNTIFNFEGDYLRSSEQMNSENTEKRVFELTIFLLDNGFNMHQRNEEGQSSMINPLSFIHRRLTKNRRDTIAKHLIQSILKYSRFNEVLQKEPFEKDPEYETYILDAHLLILAAYRTRDSQLISQLKSEMPSFILNHFEKPYVDRNGLVYSETFLDEYKKNFFSEFTRSSKHYWALSLLQRYSPSMLKYINSIKLTQDNYEEYKLDRAIYATSVIITDYSESILRKDIDHFIQIQKKSKNLKEFKVLTENEDTIITDALLKDLRIPQKKYLDMIPNDFFRLMGAEIGVKGYGLFHYCIIKSQENADWCISKLLARGMDPNIKGSRNITPLHLAIKKNSLEDTSRLLGIEEINKNVQIAVMPDEFNYQMFPIDMGASLLHLPAYLEDKTRRLEFTRLLLQNDVPTNVVDAYGKTPLRYAVLNEDKEVIKLILEKDPQALFNIGFDGQTALMDAVRTNNSDILELFLEHAKTHLVDKEENGKKLEQFMNQKNAFGMTVHDYAVCIPSRNQRIKSLLGAEQLSCRSHAFDRLAMAILQSRRVEVLASLKPSSDNIDLHVLWNYISLIVFHNLEKHWIYAIMDVMFPFQKFRDIFLEAIKLIQEKVELKTSESTTTATQQPEIRNERKKSNRFLKCFGFNCLNN